MTIVGAQDFQTGEQWQSKLLGNFSQFLAGGASHTWPDTGPATIPVANWQGTQVKVNAASAADWTFKWWADSAGTFQLGERRFTTSTTFTDTYLTLGNLGPYLTVTALNGAAGNNTASFVITGTNRILAPFQPGSSAPMLNTSGLVVGAASTTNVNAAYLYAGPAHLWLFTDATTWSIGLLHLDSAGSTGFVDSWANTEPGLIGYRHVDVILPPRPIRASFTNSDAAAHNFWVSLTPDVFR